MNEIERKRAVNMALRSGFVLENHLKWFTGGITFMPNNICNARCTCCPYPFHTDEKTTMTLEVFKMALDSALEAGHVGTVQLTPMAGEPLADPSLFEKIVYAKERGVSVINFSTNGILLNRKGIAEKIVDSGINSVHVSTPGFDPAYYKEIFGVDKADELIDGLLKVARLKTERGPSSKTLIEVSVMLNKPPRDLLRMRGWKSLLPYFENGALQIAYHRTVDQMFDHHFPGWRETIAQADPESPDATPTVESPPSPVSSIPPTAKEIKIVRKVANYVDSWSGTITDDMLPEGWGTKPVTHTTSDVPCWRLLYDVAVLPDGKIRLCSCRYKTTANDELVIGDISERPLSEIIYGEKHKALIMDVADGKWPDVCRLCSMYESAGFSNAETEFLVMEARKNQSEPSVTHRLNSEASLRSRASSKLRIGLHLLELGESDTAYNQLQSALSYSAQLASRLPADVEAQTELRKTHLALAGLYERTGRQEEASSHRSAGADPASDTKKRPAYWLDKLLV